MDATQGARVLALHRTTLFPRCYELTGLRTASVRDQMVRATNLAFALSLGPQAEIAVDRPLLVVGGGAAGVCAAYTAAVLGIPCVLVEARDRLFSRQWEVTSRWLDPTEYDFPQPHWVETTWPPAAQVDGMILDLPLDYVPAAASTLASLWDRWLFNWLEQGRRSPRPDDHPASKLSVVPGHRLERKNLRFSPAGVEWPSAPPSSPVKSFGAVISCVGQGLEDTASDPVSPFRGSLFWRTDTLCNRGLGAQRRTGQPIHALVSGGGDGAQQDIQRILCGDFGRRLLERDSRLKSGLQQLSQSGHLRQSDQQRHEALMQALSGPQATEDAQLQWDESYRQAAHNLWSQQSAAVQRRWADALLREEVARSPVHLSWLLRGRRPTYCYGLNRLLTELVLLAYQSRTRKRDFNSDRAGAGGEDSHPIVLFEHQICEVVSAQGAHECLADDEDFTCAGSPHRVRVESVAGGPPIELGVYHLIVVRHGLHKAELFGGASAREQLMPFAWAQS